MATMERNPEKILVVRLSAIGDVLFGLPGLEVLKKNYPFAEIHWLAEEKTRILVTGHDLVKRVIVFPRKELSYRLSRPWLWPKAVFQILSYLLELRREKYDIVLDLQGNLKSGINVWLSRGKRKIGFNRNGAREFAWLFVGEKVDPGSDDIHRIEKDLLLIKSITNDGDYIRPRLPGTREGKKSSVAFWESIEGNGPRIAVHPGSSAYNAYKRWPASRYGEAIKRIIEKHDARIGLIEGKNEGELVEAILRGNDGNIKVFPEEKNLLEIGEMVKEADIFLGGDSAPMHLAYLQGVPCVAIFGPKSPNVYGPYKVKKRVLRYPTTCHPCRLRSCRVPLCILGTHVRDVVGAVDSLIGDIHGKKA